MAKKRFIFTYLGMSLGRSSLMMTESIFNLLLQKLHKLVKPADCFLIPRLTSSCCTSLSSSQCKLMAAAHCRLGLQVNGAYDVWAICWDGTWHLVYQGGMHNVRLEFFLLMTATSSEAPS